MKPTTLPVFEYDYLIFHSTKLSKTQLVYKKRNHSADHRMRVLCNQCGKYYCQVLAQESSFPFGATEGKPTRSETNCSAANIKYVSPVS
jgi:hypothetical protein